MTAIAAELATPARLDVGEVVRSTVRVLRRRALDLAIVGGPFVLAPNVLVNLLPEAVQRPGNLVSALFGLVFTGGASLIAYQELTGRPRVSGWEAIRKATARYGSLWGVGVISTLMIALGTLLLIVPGLIAIASLVPASTVVMAENKGATASIERALELTRGSRWRLSGACAIVAVIIGLLLVAYLGIEFALLTWASDQAAEGVADVLGPLLSCAMVAVMTVFSASAYAALRRLKGEDANDVATVFA